MAEPDHSSHTPPVEADAHDDRSVTSHKCFWVISIERPIPHCKICRRPKPPKRTFTAADVAKIYG